MRKKAPPAASLTGDAGDVNVRVVLAVAALACGLAGLVGLFGFNVTALGVVLAAVALLV